MFLFYLLLHLLSNGKPVALRRCKHFLVFGHNGVEVHDGDSGSGWCFQFDKKEKIWAILDSNEQNRRPCNSF